MAHGAISIVGGGVAGLALGIRLRLRAVPVTVWERGQYPRHRVCGEVLSGQGLRVLQDLGLLEGLWAAGGRPARTTAFFAGQSRIRVLEMTPPALCIDRYTLDHLLACRFRELGGELKEKQRWPDSTFPAGVVRSNGRLVEPAVSGWRWIGLKGHARNVEMEADVEMHVQPFGYVGLCKLSGSRVNVCGLFRRPTLAGPDLPPPRDWLRGQPGCRLHERLVHANWDENAFCAVAGIGLRPRRAASAPECRIGDALTMTPPVTGNGMSMALEAADLVAPHLADFSRGRLNWADTLTRAAEGCDRLFRPRLRSARALHWMLFSQTGRKLLSWGGRSIRLSRLIFQLTR